MTTRTTRLSTLAILAVALAPLHAAPAGAEAHLSAQAGGFVPWQGDAGASTTLQLLGSNADGRSRWGGEFEYRSFDTKIQGVRNVDIQSFVMRGMWQHHFRPDAPFTPYVGAGLGIIINVVDDQEVDPPGLDVRGSTGAGLDGLFLIGLSARMAEYVSLFTEARLGIAFDASGRNDRDRIEFENVGGATFAAGVRFRF